MAFSLVNALRVAVYFLAGGAAMMSREYQHREVSSCLLLTMFCSRHGRGLVVSANADGGHTTTTS